jgi:dinuclear metal center YbgI/SA1388 family protein
MPSVGEIATVLEQLAPLGAAEEWDNVGLLLGDRSRPVARLMTCLTVTPTTAAEAIAERADLIVVHHPLPFRPVARITIDDMVGRLLWDLIGNGISVYSAHTAFDSAPGGINDQWAEQLGLQNFESLTPARKGDSDATVCGAGRCGELAAPKTLGDLIDHIKRTFTLDRVRFVGDPTSAVRRVAIACGSGGSFLDSAREKSCDCLITGEANFHSCLAAEAFEMSVILCGHYASERFAMELLALSLSSKFPDVNVWASRNERNPIRER